MVTGVLLLRVVVAFAHLAQAVTLNDLRLVLIEREQLWVLELVMLFALCLLLLGAFASFALLGRRAVASVALLACVGLDGVHAVRGFLAGGVPLVPIFLILVTLYAWRSLRQLPADAAESGARPP